MELIEYDFKDEEHDFKEWFRESREGLSYFADGRSTISKYIFDVDRILESNGRSFADHVEYCKARAFEHGVIMQFSAGTENYINNEYEPVSSYAIIYDTGEIHYVITTYGLDTTSNKEIFDQLVERLGNEVKPVGEETGLSGKKLEQLNSEIKQVKEEKIRTVLGNIQEQLMAESEDVSEEDRIVTTMADYLNRENKLIEIEGMKMRLRTDFPNTNPDLIESAISKHLSYTGKVLSANKKIGEIEEQEEKKRKKKSA